MKHGGNFSFGKLAGLSGYSLPYLRPLDHAYLRDRVVIDSSVTALLWPPTLSDVSPSQITSTTQITVTGLGFADTPRLQLESDTTTYELIAETFVSMTEMTAWVISIQVPPDTYDLVITNPDGQTDRLLDAVVVGP
ncbi:MAG: hypothetical protein CMJ87_13350 [Planctomycetes bacterium]|nr:hypothetical protein [Planctomycetota bacterium]